MKKISILVAMILFLSVPLTTFANANGLNESQKEETPEVGSTTVLYSGTTGGDEKLLKPVNSGTDIITPFLQQKPETDSTTLLYSGPIGGDDELLKPAVSSGSDTISPMMVIPDGSFTWTQDDTIYGSDKLVKDGWSWLATIMLGGSTGLLSFWVSKLFVSGEAAAVAGSMAGSVFGKATNGMTGTSYTYWTVKKYVDKDAYNLYDKYVVYMYTDKAKTKLKTSFTEVHSNRYK